MATNILTPASSRSASVTKTLGETVPNSNPTKMDKPTQTLKYRSNIPTEFSPVKIGRAKPSHPSAQPQGKPH